MVEFNLKKMKNLAKSDLLIQRMVKDLTKKLGNEEEAYRVVFYSEVYGDSVMENEYMNAKSS
jgi:predicted polyphosphate/ATP-dependent NAD kinase